MCTGYLSQAEKTQGSRKQAAGGSTIIHRFTSASKMTGAREGKVVRETWYLSKVADIEAGWIHNLTSKVNRKGKTFYKTETKMFMEMKRLGQSVKISMSTSSLEDADGHLLEMHQDMMLSDVSTVYDMKVQGEEAAITITTMGTPHKRSIPWEEGVCGSDPYIPEGTARNYKKTPAKTPCVPDDAAGRSLPWQGE